GLGMELGNKLWTLGMGGIGLVICHILGALQFSIVSGRSIWEAVMLVSLPYLIKDILSLIGAGVAGAYIRRTLLAAGILDGGNTV
ncbi:MAG: biotin transporter BioY, partial [Blautia sp.]